jgi:hypothetical protein
MTYIIALKNGFTVRIVRFEVRKEFYNHQYEEEGGALKAAIAYRNQQYALHGIGPRHADKPNLKVVSRTEGGSLSGVSLSIDKGSGYFIARVHDGSSWLKKRFSIKKLGYEAAFWSAVDYRLEHSDVVVDRQSITLYRPTPEEFVTLQMLAKDVADPRV